MKIINKKHSSSEIGYHFVWITKFRHPILKNGVDITLKNILGEVCDNYGWIIHSLEVMVDHIHLFIQTTPEDSPASIIQTLKSISAVKIFTVYPKLKSQKFWGTGLWSRGYYVGTCGNMSEDVIKKYINNQKIKQ